MSTLESLAIAVELATLTFGAVTAFGVLFNIRQTILAKRHSVSAGEHAKATTVAIAGVAQDVKTVEVQTNSIVGKLIETTREAATAVGEIVGRDKEIARQTATTSSSREGK
jgi:hypothetical protein